MNKILIIEKENITEFINSNSGHIFVALNLQFLGNIREHISDLSNFTFWCDGLVGKFFLFLNGVSTSKLRGVDFTKFLFKIYRFKNVAILGSADILKLQKYNLHIVYHNELLHFDITNYSVDFNALSNSSAIFITLPSPIQEHLAIQISSVTKNNIYCIGGAINMITNPKLNSPYIFNVLGMEFLYRLKTDPCRRIFRLFKSLFYFIFNLFFLLALKIKLNVK